ASGCRLNLEAAIALGIETATRYARSSARARAETAAVADPPHSRADELHCARVVASLPPAALASRSTTSDRKLTPAEIDELVAEVEGFDVNRGAAPDGGRVLATLLFTDIVGSTQRAAELGDDAWLRLLDAHVAASRRAL